MNSSTSLRPGAPPEPAGIYVHVPFCDGKCVYCAFYSVMLEPALADRWLAALESEMRRCALPEPVETGTIYVGGGTPTILGSKRIERLCSGLRRRFPLRRNGEWSIEANPGTLTRETLEALAAAGVNRLSLGAQSFDDRVLLRLGRRHTAADIFRAFELAREAGFRNIGLDLIACVPGVGPRTWQRTLDSAVALRPEHVSVYALTFEEGSRLCARRPGARLRAKPDREQLNDLRRAEKALSQAGFRRYEISNYARPGFECRHNTACWRGEDYLGFGPAAASCSGLLRWANAPDLASYLAALEGGGDPPREFDELTPRIRAAERLIFGLRMLEGVPLEAVGGFERKLEPLREQRLVEIKDGRWRMSRRGLDLADAIAVELLGD